ncbi:hypothetical protein MMC18_003800 [Xylographa bjoerkii]|nr:hypothetical protein [Xylographa bjoerkii]
MDSIIPPSSTIISGSRLCILEGSPPRKRQRINDWVDAVGLTAQNVGRSVKAHSDTTYEISKAIERRDSSCIPERLRLPAEALGNSSSQLSSELNDETMTEESSTRERMTVVRPNDPAYRTCLRARGIFLEKGGVTEPSNLQEIIELFDDTRASPGPSDNTAKGFYKRILKVGNEGGSIQALLPVLLPLINLYWESEDDRIPIHQQWERETMLMPSLEPPIAPPKPHQSFGFCEDVFPFPNAVLELQTAMISATELAWPYFTAEAKGQVGPLKVARLQNAHNGAVMFNNMLKLKRIVGKEEEFLGKIQVMTLDLTTETMALCCHWAIRNDAGNLEYHSRCLSSEGSGNPTGGPFKIAYRKAMNTVEMMKERTKKWLIADLTLLEAKLIKEKEDALSAPPASDEPTGKARGRPKGSGASSVPNSVSRAAQRRFETAQRSVDL